MTSINSLGAGTNLDLNSLYSQIEKSEQTRLTPLAKQQSSYKAKLTSWGIMQTALGKLQAAANALKDSASVSTSKVTSNNTAFTATLANGANPGNYAVEISQLAKAQTLLSKAVRSSTEDLGDTSQTSRTLIITQPGQKKPLVVALDKDQTSLSAIREAINKAQGGVTASIIKSDNNTYYLSLTSRDTGTENSMTVSSTDAKLASFLSYDGNPANSANGMVQKMPAQDAVFSVNGVNIIRGSNNITDGPEGITLKLNAKTSQPEILIVEKNNAPMFKLVQDYVDAYNSLQTTIASQAKFTVVKQGSSAQDSTNGALAGDGTLRNIQTRLQTALSTPQSGSAFSTLSQIGVTQDVNGRLTVDSAKLNKALDDKPGGVTALLSGDGKTTGFATQVSNMLTKMLDSKGVVQAAQDGINKSLKTLDGRVQAVTYDIATTMARYKTQFTRLSSMVSSMNTTSNYLTQRFSKLS
ncbi:flagellar filament capping protein FliD [Kosakonia sp. S42]|uniref:flagellar filament capping protein FliD n=1 Tax=Kosakonia sp. S42 TaxID=2767458 RepID=UPI00190C2DF7|nr:flagellar filament capping protein FliD [Kosakonia sp. S42]MBK0019600.1 flagellar filament capping protein FliD [Kosakonia sp. S42]